MEANEFIAKLKDTGADSDVIDLVSVHEEFKTILSTLAAQDKGFFALNVLCILCRNLDKVQSWSTSIDNKALLSLSIDCVQETRTMGSADRVKTLACVFHIHRHVIRQASSLPPEMVLELSYMPFESTDSDILSKYSKTYWNILADRLLYIEKLKSKKLVIIKLMNKLTKDIQTVIKIYDTVQFCSKVLVFLVKKLHFLFNDCHPKPLNEAFEKIFECLTAKKDDQSLKSLKDKDALDLYVILNECFYVIAENASKIHFKDSALDKALKTAFTLLGHKSDFFHCLQIFYLNSICKLLTENINYNFTETVLNSILTSCETTEKLGYNKVMLATYPYLSQMLRLYIEFTVANSDKKKWKQYFNIQTQENCLKLMLLLMKKLRNTEQLLKCENCKVKAGVHDSLRLSFTVKHFVSVSLAQDMDLTTTLPVVLEITQEQYSVLSELSKLSCHNHRKCLSKVQTDIHNSAILLNKSKFYEYSIKMFNLYLTNEMRHLKTVNIKNVSRGFYNKSICELDCQQYEEALKSAFLSLLFSQTEGLKSEKHISLVIEIKSKVLKSKTDDPEKTEPNQTDLQPKTVLDICEMAAKSDGYENLHLVIADTKMSVLLRHEYSVYAKLWPSVVPIAGVWKALYDLTEKKHVDWLNAEDENALNETLYEIVLDTPTAVRTIHHQHFTEIIDKLLHRFAEMPNLTAEHTLIYSICRFYRCEYDVAAARVQHGWKASEGVDLDQVLSANRTIPQEHKALREGVKAVELLTSMLPNLKNLPQWISRASLRMCEVFVHQLLLHARDAHALQLARMCCALAEAAGDSEAYLRNAGVMLHQASTGGGQIEAMLASAYRYVCERDRCDEAALVFTCQVAMFLSRRGAGYEAASLLQTAQCRLLAALEDKPELNLELATGALLEACSALGGEGPGALGAAIATQKHYMEISNTGSAWWSRRLRSLQARHLHTHAARLCTRTCAQLGAWRRARAAARGGAAAAAAAGLAARATRPDVTDDAHVKIDRIKYALGLQPSNETQPQVDTKVGEDRTTHTAQYLESVRDAQHESQASPVPCVTVPGFRPPAFLSHDPQCRCCACDTPVSFVLALQAAALEAAVYAKSKQFHIARNYYDGVFEMFADVESKLKDAMALYTGLGFDSCVVDIVRDKLKREFEQTQIQILIEACYFELAQKDYMKADDLVVRIHEIMQDCEHDAYVKNDVLDLMCASARLRETKKAIPLETGLENEMESLRLSPMPKVLEAPKTPELKAEKPPQFANKIVVSEDEVPTMKRRVIKLNLDEDEKPKPQPRARRDLKIPVPITSKPVIEAPTPRPRRVKPSVVVTQPDTPRTTDTAHTTDTARTGIEQFFTPKEHPSEEAFFTPATSVKTYTRTTLRENLVKNLEKEFLVKPMTSQVPKVKIEVNTTREKRTLRRATSPSALDRAGRKQQSRQQTNSSLNDKKK